MGEPERDEEQAGLVDVTVVPVDDVDLDLVRVEAAAQPVGGHRAARPAAQDHDLLGAHAPPPIVTSARPGRPPAALDLLRELDPGLDRAAHRARTRDTREPLHLLLLEVGAEPDRHVEPARGRPVVVIDLDCHPAELPALGPCVLHERGGDAAGERRRQQLVRRGPRSTPSDPRRLIGDDSVTAVDEDLLAERAWRRSSCRGEAHDQSVLPGRDRESGVPLNRLRTTTSPGFP